MASINNLENFNSDQHFTPKWVFDAFGIQFDLDVAASALPNFVPTKQKYTEQENGLTFDWHGLVWMNPPYSKPTPWVEKFIYHNNGIALLPITRGKWWDTIWNSNGIIVPCPYNFKFVRPDGVTRDITFRTMFFALGDGVSILSKSNIGKAR